MDIGIHSGAKRALGCLLICVFWTGALPAEVIDRIAAVVNTKTIITLSDIRRERELRNVFGEPDADDKAILQDLIDNSLIDDQMAQFQESDNVTEQEIDSALASIAIPSSISRNGLRDTLRRRLQRARYLDFRFRAFIRVTDEELRKYYDELFLPEAQRLNPGPIASFEETREMVRENIIKEKMKGEIDKLLKAIRDRSDVEIL